MFAHPVLLIVLAALLALVVLILWSGWQNRRTDFIYAVSLGAYAAEAESAFFDRVLPILVEDGYRAAAAAGHTTVLERRYQPAWTVLVAIFLFPFGLIALLARGRESVTVVAANGGLEVRGHCTKPMADFIIAVVNEGAGVGAGHY